MKVSTRSKTKENQIATKRFDIRLDADVVNAYRNGLLQPPQQHQQRQQIQQERCERSREIRTKQTTITIVRPNNRRTIQTTNVASASNSQVTSTQVDGPVSNAVARKSLGTVTNSSSSVKKLFHRNIDQCFNALMALNEQHAHAKINLKTEYNAKLEVLKRDFDRRVEEVKRKCISDAGF